MATFNAFLISAVAYGAVLIVAAVGFLVLYKATGVINFAHGDLITFGGLVAFWSINDLGLPIIAGYLLTLGLMFGAGVGLERIAYAPLRGRPILVIIIATLAASLVIRAIAGLWQGTAPKRLPSPVGTGTLNVFGAQVAYQRILILVLAAVVVGALLFAFQRTGIGRQLRALASDADTAQLYGVRSRRISMLAWGLSAALASLAAILLAPLTALDLNFGFGIMVAAFAATVAGGFGSIRGAILGALAVGLIYQLLGAYVLSNYASILPYVAMLALLAVRPHGLLGSATTRL